MAKIQLNTTMKMIVKSVQKELGVAPGMDIVYCAQEENIFLIQQLQQINITQKQIVLAVLMGNLVTLMVHLLPVRVKCAVVGNGPQQLQENA